MANEIRFSASLRYASGLKAASLSASGMANQAGTEYVQKTQEIGITEEVLDQGDIATIGWVIVRNADATHFIELGATTAVYTIKVPAGGVVMAPWDGSTIYALADTSICQVEYLLIEA